MGWKVWYKQLIKKLRNLLSCLCGADEFVLRYQQRRRTKQGSERLHDPLKVKGMLVVLSASIQTVTTGECLYSCSRISHTVMALFGDAHYYTVVSHLHLAGCYYHCAF